MRSKAMNVNEMTENETATEKKSETKKENCCTKCGVVINFVVAGMDTTKCWGCNDKAAKKAAIEKNLNLVATACSDKCTVKNDDAPVKFSVTTKNRNLLSVLNAVVEMLEKKDVFLPSQEVRVMEGVEPFLYGKNYNVTAINIRIGCERKVSGVAYELFGRTGELFDYRDIAPVIK
jgi:hypothetical protein